MPAVRQCSGGLPAPILRLTLRPSSVAGGGRQPPRDDIGGAILAVSRAAEHFIVKLSGKLSLAHCGPSGFIETRSYLGVIPRPLMLSSTTRGGLRLFGIEVV